ncbi:MAG: MarR family winged helix-turn-helix transcriptional regulator [Candidatus Pacebacteria bacterium]|nr:MarR family winged helix-turn-helix transcriptional regulator [Candidatus Paceibacterota bacterium]
MKKPKKEKNEDDFAPALIAASRAMVAAGMAELIACGFDSMTPALVSLMPLLDKDGVRPTALSQQARVTKQAIGQLVRELEARVYVEQLPDSTDTRAKIVRLTKRGVVLQAACAKARRKLQSVAIAKLGKSKVLRLQQDLIELAVLLEKTRTR